MPTFNGTGTSVHRRQPLGVSSGNHHYAHDGHGEVFDDTPPVSEEEKRRALMLFARSPLDTDSHRLVTRVHRIDVDSTQYDETEGTLHLPINLREVVGLEFHKGSVPRHGYNVDAGTFVATVGGTGYTVTVDAGQYTTSTFAAHVQQALIDDTGDGTFTCTYSAVTEKFTIANGGSTFLLQFTTGMIGYSLGFGHDTFDFSASPPVKTKLTDTTFPTSGAANTVTSPYRADLVGGRYMEMHAPDLDPYYGNSGALIDSVHIIDDLNIDAGNDREARRFIQTNPKIYTLSVNLRVRLPTGERVVYNPHRRAFHLTFRVFTLDMEKIRRRPLYK